MSYSDYYPFGMIMPGRNDSETSYRFGFNGMEGDDEIKGSKNSYDFGARMYDPRVARWLSRDALEASKSSLSPYQSFRNNPLVFNDPDGMDEWNVIVVKDQKGNVVKKAFARVSTLNYMSSGIKEVSDGGGGYYRMSNGYDFKNEMTFQLQDDGSIKYLGTEQVLLKKHGIKDREYGPWAKKSGTKYTTAWFGTGYEQPGGMYLYSKDGGEGTKYYSRNDVESMEVDDLLAIMGVLTKGGFKSFSEGAHDVMKIVDKVRKYADKTGWLPDGEEDYGVQSNKDIEEQRKVVVIRPDTLPNGEVNEMTSKETPQEAETYTNGQYTSDKKDTLIVKDPKKK
ncbi:RHS repeat-associated core domain-containing protein [uncultured Maribacter sp.]|uniref:RHS repeat domain-containing protein n=1 Tax=uncultured Maribacter sp. TaxID=431308 RepID=UPI0030EB25DB